MPAVLVAVLVAGWAVAADAASGTTVSGPSPFAACATNNPAAGSTGEPYAAIGKAPGGGGTMMIAVWIQDGGVGDVSASSRDGGSTWRETPLPFSSCARRGINAQAAVDPWVSIGAGGRAYAGGLSLTFDASGQQARSAVLATTSGNGGHSWKRPVTLASLSGARGQGLDKPMLVADGVKAGRAYAVWERRAPEGTSPPAAYFARTLNGGRTWSKPRRIVSTAGGTRGAYDNHLLVDSSRGTLFDVFNLVRQEANGTGPPRYSGYVALVRSRDNGKHWSQPRIIGDDLSLGFVAGSAGTITAGMGIDGAIDTRHHTLVAVWTDARFSNLTHDDVVLSRSTDGGQSWSAPVAVSRAAEAFNPAVALGSDGTIGVLYDDLRANGAAGAFPVTTWFVDAGATGTAVSPEMPVATYDISHAPVIDGGYFVGDYQALVAHGQTFRAFYPVAPAGATGMRMEIDTVLVTLARRAARTSGGIAACPRALSTACRPALASR